jgi:hypothetical protein
MELTFARKCSRSLRGKTFGKSDDFIPSRSCVETKSNAGDDEGVHQTDWFAVVQAENSGGQDDEDW